MWVVYVFVVSVVREYCMLYMLRILCVLCSFYALSFCCMCALYVVCVVRFECICVYI